MTRLRVHLRVVTMIVLGAYIVGGPFAVMVLHVPERWFRPWAMFSSVGVGHLLVELARVDEAGELVPIDRQALLGRPRGPFPGRQKLKDEKDAGKLADRACAKLGGQADVRMRLRRATRQGWRELVSFAEPQCGD